MRPYILKSLKKHSTKQHMQSLGDFWAENIMVCRNGFVKSSIFAISLKME